MSDESRSRSASPNPMEQWEQEEPAPQSPQPQQAPKRSSRRRQQQQQPQPAQQQDQQLLPAGGAGQALQGPTNQAGQLLGNTLGQVTGGQQQQSGQGGKDTLKLRLDLNLDVDVQIKARIHGDVTLSLLTRPPQVDDYTINDVCSVNLESEPEGRNHN